MRNLSDNKAFASSDTVLIVEDDYISSLLLQEFLMMENFRVLSARDGSEALSIVRKKKEQIDIVFMDILMPKMNGIEAAEEIKKINQNIPVIAQTSQAYNLRNYDLSKFDALIIKPIDFTKLREIIQTSKLKQQNKTQSLSVNNQD